jgi:hypothetical protein
VWEVLGKPRNGGKRPRVLADEMYATKPVYTSTKTARLEAMKAAAKSPLRSVFPLFIGVLYGY